jgi:hypothetical protein
MQRHLLIVILTIVCAGACSNVSAQQEKDTVFLQNGSTYVGRIVEYRPEVEVSIVTENGDAFVVPISKVLRIARNTVIHTGTGRRAEPRPAGYWTDNIESGLYTSGSLLGNLAFDAGSIQYMGSNVGRSNSSIIGSVAYGVGALANVGYITKNGNSFFVNGGYGIGDYGLSFDENLTTYSGSRSVIGLGFGLDGQNMYISSSVNYVQSTYRFQYRFSSFPDIQSERFTGIGFTSHFMFPLTSLVGFTAGPSLEYMVLDHGGTSFLRIHFEVGITWSTVLKSLNKYY